MCEVIYVGGGFILNVVRQVSRLGKVIYVRNRKGVVAEHVNSMGPVIDEAAEFRRMAHWLGISFHGSLGGFFMLVVGAGNAHTENCIFPMRGILINPFERSIQYVETSGEPQEICKLIGSDCINSHNLGPHEYLFMDDDRALRESAPHFDADWWPWPIFGPALILGSTLEGKKASTHQRVEQLSKTINFS